MAPKLFTPVQVGALHLKHRVVLAPLTRFRGNQEHVPAEYSVEYYEQRASDGGLLITEAAHIHPEAGLYRGAPGIWSAEQIARWKKVTSAVHAKGGFILLQLWAHGRVTDASLVDKVYGVSANLPLIAASTFPKGPVTQMTEADIDRFVGFYRQAALNAIEAGFDGVEIHGANGYLLDQFLQSVSNDRTDAYGGSLENRFRFPLRVLNAVAGAIGAERVGYRISPFSTVQDMREPVPMDTFLPFTRALLAAQPDLAYVHAVSPRAEGVSDKKPDQIVKEDTLSPIRAIVQDAGSHFIVAGGFTPASALADAEEHDDLVAFGRHFIANPDLPARIAHGWDLNRYNRKTFYSPGEVGYTDYPVYPARL